MKAVGFVMPTIISRVDCVVNTENKQALNQISSVTSCLLLYETLLNTSFWLVIHGWIVIIT